MHGLTDTSPYSTSEEIGGDISSNSEQQDDVLAHNDNNRTSAFLETRKNYKNEPYLRDNKTVNKEDGPDCVGDTQIQYLELSNHRLLKYPERRQYSHQRKLEVTEERERELIENVRENRIRNRNISADGKARRLHRKRDKNTSRRIPETLEVREKRHMKFRQYARKRFRRLKEAIKNNVSLSTLYRVRSKSVEEEESDHTPSPSETEKWSLRPLVVLVERIDVDKAIQEIKSS